jgi:hypothetical protein
MTLYDQNDFKLYMEGAKRIHAFRAIPMDVTTIASGLENTYTYGHWDSVSSGSGTLYFAIGKAKET